MSWDITGHEWAVEMLSGHCARGEMRHAYLFCGPPGVGRRTLALRFAQAVNCQNPPAPGVPCRTCRSCRHIESLQHPDLFVVEKLPDKTEITIDQVRALQHSLTLSPYESAYKIGLLLKFHEASDEAQNALLKMLEEAPRKAILLLTSDSPEAVFPTVLSRCEVLRLRPAPVAHLAEFLTQATGVSGKANDPDEMQLVARLADGRLGQARRLLGDAKALEQRKAWLDKGFELFGMSRRQRIAAAGKAFGEAKDQKVNRERMRQALGVWVSLWRDILLCAGGADVDATLVNLDATGRVEEISRQVGFNQARLQIERLEEALEKLDPPYHANPRLLGEILLLDWPVV